MYISTKPSIIIEILIMSATSGPANSKKDRKLSLRPIIDRIRDKNPNKTNIYPKIVMIGLSIVASFSSSMC